MRYILDTNVFLFSLSDRDRLMKEVKHILGDYGNLLYVSAESVKEILYLLQCGKYRSRLWKSAEDVIDYIQRETTIEIKHIKDEHLRTLSKLPFYKDHKDPFDRMIIAHAITEKTTLISSDGAFSRYRRHGLELIYNET